MDSIKGRLVHCMLRGGGCLGKSEKIIEKDTLRVLPDLRGGSCPLTKANPGRGHCTIKGLELSCFGILYDAGWGMGTVRRVKETGLWQTVQCTSGLLKSCNRGRLLKF